MCSYVAFAIIGSVFFAIFIMSCVGALTHFSCKLNLKKNFHHPGAAGAPTAPPGYAYAVVDIVDSVVK